MAAKPAKVTPDPRYRENPQRCIRIFGEFNDALAERVLIELAALRTQSVDPITVYIHSDGGSFRVLEVINGALNGRDQDGKTVHIITVCCSKASSAAANLLAFGDYALVYPNSRIWFHGVRQFSREVTAEEAAVLARHFSSIDRSTANELAYRVFSRLVHRYILLRPEALRIQRRAKKKKESRTWVICFTDALLQKIGADAATIVRKSVIRLLERNILISSVLPRALRRSRVPPLRQDANVLRYLIDHEVESHKPGRWRLDENGMAELTADYLLLREYFFGSHVAMIERSIRTFASVFLSNRDFKRFTALNAAGKESPANAILYAKARPKAEPFFFFAHLLCRNLMQGENDLSPSDAYWLGIVDEVVGTRFVGLREIVEQPAEAPPPPNAPPVGAPAVNPAPGSTPNQG